MQRACRVRHTQGTGTRAWIWVMPRARWSRSGSTREVGEATACVVSIVDSMIQRGAVQLVGHRRALVGHPGGRASASSGLVADLQRGSAGPFSRCGRVSRSRSHAAIRARARTAACGSGCGRFGGQPQFAGDNRWFSVDARMTNENLLNSLPEASCAGALQPVELPCHRVRETIRGRLRRRESRETGGLAQAN